MKFVIFNFRSFQDQHDIKLLTYLMLSRLAVLCPSQVFQRLDSLCEPLKVFSLLCIILIELLICLDRERFSDDRP